jgi:hypothetical protein
MQKYFPGSRVVALGAARADPDHSAVAKRDVHHRLAVVARQNALPLLRQPFHMRENHGKRQNSNQQDPRDHRQVFKQTILTSYARWPRWRRWRGRTVA